MRYEQLAIMLLFALMPATAQQSNIPLRALEKVEQRLTKAAPAIFSVPISAGDFLKVEVLQTGADLIVSLRDAEGVVLAEVDSPNGYFGPETIVALVPSGGLYTVEVKLVQEAAGSCQVTLLERRPAQPGDAETVAAHRLFSEALQLRQKPTATSLAQALKIYERAALAFQALQDPYNRGLALKMQALLLAGQGQTAAALDLSRQAAAVLRDAGSPSAEASAQTIVGGMSDLLGNFKDASQAFQRALALNRQTGDPGGEAVVLSNLGKLENDAGRLQASLDDYKQALLAIRKTSDTRREGLILANIGTAHHGLGDFEGAMRLYEEALPKRRAAGDRRGEGDTLRNMGEALNAMNYSERALEHAEKAVQIYVSLGDKRAESEALILLSIICIDLKQFARAEKALNRILELQQTVKDRRGTARAWYELSRLLLLKGQNEAALENGKHALAEFRAIGDRSSEAQALEAVARAQFASGDRSAATQLMEQVVRMHEEARGRTSSQQLRASSFARRHESYLFYIELLIRGNQPELALEVSERSRARSLLEMLAESNSAVESGIAPALRQRERDLSAALNSAGARLLPVLGRETPQTAALKKEIATLESDYRDLEAEIRKSNSHYAELSQPRPLTATQIREELLDDETVLLHYSLGSERSFVWVAGKMAVQVYELPSREFIERQAEAVLEAVLARGVTVRMENAKDRESRIAQADSRLTVAAKQLTATVLGPVASAINGRRLAIVPDGGLQRIPFAMLPEPNGNEPLVVKHEIVVLPSASALAVQRRELANRPKAGKCWLCLPILFFDRADPRAVKRRQTTIGAAVPGDGNSRILEQPTASAVDQMPSSLHISRLPYTRQEGDQILNLVPGSGNLRAMDFDASRDAATSAKLGEYRYLHFATHGLLDAERPGLSALVLSQLSADGASRDGFLRVNDIYNSRLSADLVVLSACQTGLGKEVRGEGLMGLTRAFFYAGAPRVIVSLWNVNDRATAELMTSLYKKMLRSGKAPAKALREAQLELRQQKRWASPYYWAAFVQQGEWN